MVVEAIKRVPAGNDYVIIDRCAGTGNLEYCLNDFSNEADDILSHVIISSPEYKEWQVLKERLGGKVRHLLPKKRMITKTGYLEGADALSEEFLDNPIIKQYVENEKCSIILFENPPYAQGSSATNQRDKIGKEACEWKNSYVVQEMKKEVAGTATNEMCNAFIWSGFKYYLRQPTDSYIVFAPAKYWKYHGLARKKMIDGYGFNRQYFHASSGFVSCIAWANIEDEKTEKITLNTFSIKDEDRGGGVERIGEVDVKKIHSIHSNGYYDKRTFNDDVMNDGILVDAMNGIDYKNGKKDIKVRVASRYNPNIVGYMISKGSTLTSPGLSSNLMVASSYDGNGCFLRTDNFYQYLPSFAGTQFMNNVKDWTAGIYGASADMAEHYWLDVKNGKLNNFLFKTLFWVCFTQHSHMVSQVGSDGRLYLNQLCYQEGTLARKYIDKYIAEGYKLTDDEKELIALYERLTRAIKATEEYNKDFTYGIFQIGLQIDTTYRDDNGKVQHNHGDVFNLLKVIKKKTCDYYVKELAPVLLKYEFVK